MTLVPLFMHLSHLLYIFLFITRVIWYFTARKERPWCVLLLHSIYYTRPSPRLARPPVRFLSVVWVSILSISIVILTFVHGGAHSFNLLSAIPIVRVICIVFSPTQMLYHDFFLSFGQLFRLSHDLTQFFQLYLLVLAAESTGLDPQFQLNAPILL